MIVYHYPCWVIDDKLSWNTHTNNIVSKLMRDNCYWLVFSPRMLFKDRR